ncbi:hypothetical protein FHR83_001559 [Actinoplanes campanulatus]|uniref:Uncharacterized protein n=1 Tax=Actinoplanes campanulatus TaxID=113559 RepID=A0A7W5FD41_9ACTN|nr:hypothetical protein [Actinoplanes campanulatus]MBB3093910.1 hypothetical protein [Actinoplanes campanulatus]GGN33793.1 hypothetical protein GCM10010109_56190 [Actinoplanes campanulatus]GID38394.1 hypothetical protein Aca09nite_49000 [Actinoplanes campanulatus]
MLMALLLDIANIVGGLLLAIPLLGRFPVVARVTARIAPWRWLVGIVALVAGGYFLIVHLVSGPHLFHFEVVGIAVGVLLAWERLTGRRPLVPATPVTTPAAPSPSSSPEPATVAVAPADLAGPALLVAVFGIIAIIVGLQGLFTPN